MTGREIALYILENGLENEEILDKDGKPAGMMTPEEAAEKFGVQLATITAWLGTGKLMSFYIGGTHYIPATAENPNKWASRNIKVENKSINKLANAMEGMVHEA